MEENKEQFYGYFGPCEQQQKKSVDSCEASLFSFSLQIFYSKGLVPLTS